MRDITHSDGVVPPWDWIIAFFPQCWIKGNKPEMQINWKPSFWSQFLLAPLCWKSPFPYANLFLLWCTSSTFKKDTDKCSQSPLSLPNAGLMPSSEEFSQSWLSRSSWEHPHRHQVMNSRCDPGLHSRRQVLFIQKQCDYPLRDLLAIIIIVFVALPTVTALAHVWERLACCRLRQTKGVTAVLNLPAPAGGF